MREWAKNSVLKVLAFVMILAAVSFGYTVGASAATEIPDGAKEFEGHMYYVYIENSYITMEAAETRCEAVGGHLVSITSASEQEFVRKLLVDSGERDSAWIGGIFNDTVAKWISNEKMTYIPGNAEEPNKNYPYLYMHNDGRWDNRSNTSSNTSYICEWDTGTETVLPKKVAKITVKKVSKTSVTVSWKEISDAEGYAVYMKVGKDGTYEKIADTEDMETASIYKEGLTKGKTYYFRVRAYKTIYGERSYGELSPEKKIALK